MLPTDATAPHSVLIIDDMPASVEHMRHVLGTGYEIYAALDGEAGLALAGRVLPDVVLLDVRMPGLDGYDVCRRMRADPVLAPIPVIMISALDDRGSRLTGLEAGADDFVSKPVDALELRTRVKTITTMNRFRKSLDERVRFELLFTASPDPIVLIHRATGAVLLANAAATRDIGHADPFWDAVHAGDRPTIEGMVQGMSGSATVSVPVRMVDTEGRAYLSEWTVAPTIWEGQAAAVLSVRNVSARIADEAHLRQAERITAIIQATADQAHDFGNQLMAIRSGVHIARGALTTGHRAEELLGEVERNIEQAGLALQRIKQLSKGANRLDIRPVDVGAFVRDLDPVLGHLLQGREMTHASLTTGRRILADTQQLRHVLMNLVANARDATGAEGAVDIAVGYRPAEPGQPATVTLTVADNGCGMPPDVLRRMFDPYFTTKEGHGGTGIGLTAVHSIVTLQRGRIDTRSEVGRGTTITITWPECAEDTPLDHRGLAHADSHRHR